MKIEIRNDHVVLDGYVNAVGRDSRILPSAKGKFVEQIVPKTFQKALENAVAVDLLFNHKKDRKLGSTAEGNLQLHEDNIGLRAICTVSDEEVMEKAKKGELRGWSFGFIANKCTWEDTTTGIQRRFVEDMELLEVSILDKTPAYIATSIEQRGEDECISEQRTEQFTATVTDQSTGNDPKPEETDEKREFDYSLQEKQIQILKSRGWN